MKFNWTPQQIGQLDPDYVEELQARLLAEYHHERERDKKAKKDKEKAKP